MPRVSAGEEQDREPMSPGRVLAWAAAGAAVVLVIAGAVVAPHRWDWAPIGDVLAPLNGLFSAVALAAAVVSVFMQRSELALQRRELQLAREEARLAREAQEAMAAETKRANDLQAQANRIAALSGSIAIVNAQLTMFDATARVLPNGPSVLLKVVNGLEPRINDETTKLSQIKLYEFYWRKADDLAAKLDLSDERH